MDRTNFKRGVGVAGAVVALIVTLGTTRLEAAEPNPVIHVVVEASVDVASITVADLKAIYLGSRNFWRSDLRITPFLRPVRSKAGKSLYRNVLHMTPGRFRHHWQRLELSGRGTMPRTISAAREVAERVAAVRGGLAVVGADEVEAIRGLPVRVVRVHLR